MPIVDTTTSTLRKIASHDIKFHGLAGVILFSSLAALLLYIVGFATEGWLTIELPVEVFSGFTNDSLKLVHVGLWKSCYCGPELSEYLQQETWFSVSRVLVILGLLGLAVTFTFATLYMFVHRLSKDRVIQGLIGSGALSVLVVVVGVTIFGVRSSSYASEHAFAAYQSFSFAFVIIGGILAAVVATLGLVQNLRSRSRGAL